MLIPPKNKKLGLSMGLTDIHSNMKTSLQIPTFLFHIAYIINQKVLKVKVCFF